MWGSGTTRQKPRLPGRWKAIRRWSDIPIAIQLAHAPLSTALPLRPCGRQVMQPSTAEYWHIDAMTMRLDSSRAPTRNGVNSALILSSPYSWRSAAREVLVASETYPHYAGTDAPTKPEAGLAAGYGARTICLHSDGKPASVSGGFGLRGGECSVDSLNQKSSRG
jgi:hypothetical protein